MHRLTSQGNWELRIDYQLKNGSKSYLHYNKFAIGSAEDHYPLNMSGFDSIGLTDPFDAFPDTLNGMKFSSHDGDNDLWSGNCALRDGGWWHRSCSYIQLNDAYTAIYMYLNDEPHYPTSVEMKIRPQNCNID